MSMPTRCLAGLLLTVSLLAPEFIQAQKPPETLRIGVGGDLSLEGGTNKNAEAKEAQALESLKSFVKTETGFANEILRQKGWHDVSTKLANGQLELGMFQGYEYAWARAQHPTLRPLALAVNGQTYRTAIVLVHQDNKVADFAGMANQSLALPRAGQAHLRFFVVQQTLGLRKEPTAFFGKITTPDNFEDALDDVVDGTVLAAVVDRVGLDAYQRRKPGRFARLKELVRSEPFPPPVVAYREGALDAATLQRLRGGLLGAGRKKEGERLFTLFRLTGFEEAPADFDKVVADTLKRYPPP